MASVMNHTYKYLYIYIFIYIHTGARGSAGEFPAAQGCKGLVKGTEQGPR